MPDSLNSLNMTIEELQAQVQDLQQQNRRLATINRMLRQQLDHVRTVRLALVAGNFVDQINTQAEKEKVQEFIGEPEDDYGAMITTLKDYAEGRDIDLTEIPVPEEHKDAVITFLQARTSKAKTILQRHGIKRNV